MLQRSKHRVHRAESLASRNGIFQQITKIVFTGEETQQGLTHLEQVNIELEHSNTTLEKDLEAKFENNEHLDGSLWENTICLVKFREARHLEKQGLQDKLTQVLKSMQVQDEVFEWYREMVESDKKILQKERENRRGGDKWHI